MSGSSASSTPPPAGGQGLSQPVTVLRGVAGRLAGKLEKLGLRTVGDVLFHLPHRDEDRTHRVPIGSLQSGQHALVRGRVELAEVAQGRRKRLMCRVSDGTGSLTLVFFHYFPNQLQQFRQGRVLECYGEARPGVSALQMQMVHPEYSIVSDLDAPPEQPGLTPVYPATEGVNQTTLRRLADQALNWAREGLGDLLPAELLEGRGLPDLFTALQQVHHPAPDSSLAQLDAGVHPAQRRLALEELLAHHLSLRQVRHRLRADRRAPVLRGTGRLVGRFLEQLPFSLTNAQQRVEGEVARDMASAEPMLRLVQGDVGSGKTVVAALAALRAVESGQQAAVMAPTELLAEQHYRNFRDWLQPLGVDVAWMSGKLPAARRREMLQAIAEGRALVAVGTHALFQEQVTFHRLGLVIVDEQHRFGVHQRMALKEKGQTADAQPHQLIMTATPIPRTLAMTAYADLDVSIIDELPPGRTPIRTVAVPDSRREEVVAGIAAACSEGRQAYWVCTLIEESDQLQAEAAEATEAMLKEAIPEVSVALVHGRMKPADKEAVMARFAGGEVQLLVATTVIEVGVDVPNASLMVIENPERLGLAQLHQLRGRVGRGTAASSCVLLYRAPLTDMARRRLGVLRETTDGFEIARQDLELRGPGELLGTRQTGAWQFRVADLTRDGSLLPDVQVLAERLLQEDMPRVDALIERWVGEAQRYGRV
ncbi:MAG: ATP-dependent DNA helicase RecG [Ectothiorhodospiraceae bacterium]|nr:ATP-dependent DNA helicase RecG [Ectothiorhodospiraceae bacterium]